MTRKRLVTAIIVLAGALVMSRIIAASEINRWTIFAFDLFFFLLAFSTLSRKRPALTISRETGRLIFGLLFFTLAYALSFLTQLVATQAESAPRAEALWILISRSFTAFGYAWLVLILVRLGGTELLRKRRLIVGVIVAALILSLLDASPFLIASLALFMVLFVLPYNWERKADLLVPSNDPSVEGSLCTAFMQA